MAAGVIAQAIDHLTALNTPRTDVIYICSNRAIARQNVERIRHRFSIDTKPLAERITLLPHRLGTLDKPVNRVSAAQKRAIRAVTRNGEDSAWRRR